MAISRRGFLQNVPGIFTLSSFGSIEAPLFNLGNRDNPALLRPHRTDIPCSVVRTDHSERTKKIESDEWIIHEASWVTVGDEGPQALRDLLSATTHEFFIDGAQIENSCDYWQLNRSKLSKSELCWQYLTAPKSGGKHSFRVDVEFDEPLKTRQNQGLTTVDGFRRYLGGYSVVP